MPSSSDTNQPPNSSTNTSSVRANSRSDRAATPRRGASREASPGEDVTHLITVHRGIEFDTRTLEFVIDRVPPPSIGSPFTVWHWRYVDRLLRYDDSIRDGSAILEEPVPPGYDELRTTLRNVIDPSEASLSLLIHDISAENETRADIQGSSPRSILFNDAVRDAIRNRRRSRREPTNHQPSGNGPDSRNPPSADVKLRNGQGYSFSDMEVINYAMMGSVRAKMKRELIWRERRRK